MSRVSQAEIQARETWQANHHRAGLEYARRCGEAARRDPTKEHHFHDPEQRAAYNAAKRGES
jgi:hypothetical protein